MSQSRGSSALKDIARSTRDLYAPVAIRGPPKPPAPSPLAMQHDLAEQVMSIAVSCPVAVVAHRIADRAKRNGVGPHNHAGRELRTRCSVTLS